MNARTPIDLTQHKIEESSNTSANPSIDAVMAARLSRRGLLRGGMGGAATMMLGGLGTLGLTACGGGDDTTTTPTETLLGFNAVSKSVADAFTVPTGYTAQVLIAVGDPLAAGVSAYKNDGTDNNFEQRCGEWHDGMEYFGLSATGARDDASNTRALLGINHEWLSQDYLHANGATAAPRPAAEVDIETAAMGVSVVEIAKGTNGRFAYVQGSSFNRRITTLTEIQIAGPARGNAKLKTKYSPDGTVTRGTINNCGTGKTPWGTYLTGEENWVNFFFRAAGDQALRSAHENVALARYGRNVTGTTAAAHAYGWNTVTSSADQYARWNTSVTGTSTDGTDDYRNEINGQGYITEIDPYNPTSVIKKRTALGRMAHEGAAFSKPVAGQPIAIVMGDDARNEYIYKFVSDALWDPADASRSDRMAVGDKYLDAGKLYAAKFNADGTGEWVLLDIGNPAISGYATYTFADQGDVLIHARIAADAAGATKMDRPEWSYTNPANGEVYVTLTNNSGRTTATANAANPRAYSDVYAGTTVQNGNVNGHIVRMKDSSGNPAATTFGWDIYLFGAESDADTSRVNLSGLTADQDFSSPDGIVFTGSTGLCWIQTDDGALTDETNCMMLAAIPGQIGDGGPKTIDYGSTSVTTQMGAQPTQNTLKRFLVGPVGQEITGLAESPDGKVMFVNVQHPEGNWPANAGYGAGGANGRPRSATVMITKDDGGRIGT
jgi:uncharacterized protein